MGSKFESVTLVDKEDGVSDFGISAVDSFTLLEADID